MWFSLFVVVLILAITFYQGLLGLFSGALNFFLAVLAAALAFGLYETIYFSHLLSSEPEDGRGIALMGIFFVSLLVMRIIFDLLIKDNMHFPIYVDRVGGGVFGFLTAMIIIGTLSVAIQMLPFPYQWLGYSRYAMFNADSGTPVDLTPQEDKQTEADMLAKVDLSKVSFVRKKIWLNPDGFTTALVSHLSDNALGGGTSFAAMNATLLDDLHWARFTQIGQNKNIATKAEGVQVEACWELPEEQIYILERAKEGNNKKWSLRPPGSKDKGADSGNRYLGVRVSLSSDLADDNQNFRFTTQQVKLVTKGSGGKATGHYLVGVDAAAANAEGKEKKDIYYTLARGETIERVGGNFDFVFEVPKEAEPWFLEFRTNARAEIKGVDKDAPPRRAAPGGGKKSNKPGKNRKQENQDGDAQSEKPDDQDSGDSGNSGDTGHSENGRNGKRRPKPNLNKHENADPGAEARSGGRTKRVTSDTEGSFFSNEMPFELTEYTANDVEVRGGKVIGGGGRIIAKFDEDYTPAKGNRSALTDIAVPEGKVLLHLSTTRLHPGSTYGQAKDFVGQIKNVKVMDDKRQEYSAVGVWAVATVGRERVFEMVYYDETTRMSGAAVPRTDKIRRDDMDKNYLYYFMFEVPPGTRIVQFLAGTGNGEDVTDAKLVAPKLK